MKKKYKIVLLAILIIPIIAVGCFVFFENMNMIKKTIHINSVLSHKSYSYLPKEAKEYIKEVYEETGEVILTEKNKKENKLYLNPQYIEYLTYTEEEKSDVEEIPISMIIDYSTREIAENINVPISYDLRNDNGKNYVTPIRNQGKLGICWTFATAGAVESHLLKVNNSSYNASSKLISERQIDYATSRNGIKDYKSEYVSFVKRSLGDGGNFYISTIALANGISLFNYNDFKEYNDRDLQKMELSDVLNYSKSLYEVNSTINFPRLNIRESTSILTEEEIETRDSYLKEVKQNIIENGAAYVGTYMDASCRYTDSNLNNTVIDVYNCNISGGHAMEIIGWNDNLKYSYCADTKLHNSNILDCKRVVSGKGVWILKNSWGDTLQYPYLTYDSLYTSISFIDEVESSQNKNWDNNYILGDGSEDVKSNTYTLNNTKIKNDEKIKKVKFITENPETEYNVKIRKKDGSYRIFSKISDLPGLMTIDITEDILVNKDTEITIYSENGFIDKVSIFTSNVNTTPNVDLSKYDNTALADNNMRLYSETKNIPSGATITYKVYNSNEQDVSNKVTFTNNVVAENNINTLASFSSDLDSDTYRVDAIYNSNVVRSMNIDIVKMEGLGTKNNPYIITNSTQLYQIRDDLDAYYELGNDIDLTEDTHEGGKYSLESNTCPQGFGWEAINGFSGSLDGKGHTIKGLYQNNYLTCNEEKETWHEWNNNGNGLFGSMKGNATVKNLVLDDFDINCQGGYCAALVSKYISNMNDSGNENYSDHAEYTATFQNIAIKNSKIHGVYNRSNSNNDLKESYVGGLFGNLKSFYGNINISNIYLDINLTIEVSNSIGYFVNSISGKKVDIQNIRLLGNFYVDYVKGILGNDIFYGADGKIQNIISTLSTSNNIDSFLGVSWSNSLQISGINMLDINNTPLCKNTAQDVSNVNVYDKDTQIVELTKQENYSSWVDFNNNWEIKTIDGISRIPVLNFMDFEYTSISDITLNQILNKKVSIYDYLTPKIDAAKQLLYSSNNEEVVTMGEDGLIIPQSTGNTTIHVESLYDGYIKDVPISVTYVPHYTIKFDANGGTGTMESIEVETGKNFKLPENEFVKEYYELKEWNTKEDGTGTSYDNLEEIPAMNDKESITLYAIWWGEERIVTFNANGGTVNPDRKMVRIRQKYGDLPVPIRDGYGFAGWNDLKGSLYVDAFAQFSESELTAHWITDAYTILYDANGGTIKEEYKNKGAVYLHSETIATDYGKNGQDKDVYDYLYEREGYTFKEWNTKADGSGTSYTDEQMINRSSNITLYAIWESETGTITYNSNYGTNQTKTQTFTFNIDTKLDKNSFTREGYTFKEWNTNADGTGDSYSNEETIIFNKSLILYAQWQEKIAKYTVTFNSDGGSSVASQTVNYNDKATKPSNPTKTGYTFKEWQLNENTYNFDTVVTGNITLKAVWNENQQGDTLKNLLEKDGHVVNNGYTSKFTIGDSISSIKTKLGNDVVIETDKEIIATGAVIKRGNESYTVVIKGDLNGDGKVNSADLLQMRKYLLEEINLAGAYKLAGIIESNGEIKSLDLLRLRQYLLEEYEFK